MSGAASLRFWVWPSELRGRGVLGINNRNVNFLAELNPRGLYPRVDDKILTKKLCETHGISIPETYAVIERFGGVRGFPDIIGQRQQFVVKPSRGGAGRGVLVIVRQNGATFETSHGEVMPLAEMLYHLSTVLSGLYSLGGRPDRVIVEERIMRHPVFERLTVGGTPDIRIVLCRGTPLMAMLRLPTRASRGRANLHQGAVAAGINLETGRTLGGVCRNRAISTHPDTGEPVEGVGIPFWTDSLKVASMLGEALEIGYTGVDIVLDAKRGPVVLEANARPGLAIQIANRTGLLEAVKRDWRRSTRSARSHELADGVVTCLPKG